MRTDRTTSVTELRAAIDQLPRPTREAMLRGITSRDIIVGAYAQDGGVCPMLAAHREGGRTSFIAFARAWDRFAFRGAEGRRARVRKATERELTVLRAHLEMSLIADEWDTADLRGAINDHRRALRRREREASRLSRELARAERWPFRLRRRAVEAGEAAGERSGDALAAV